MPGCFGSVIPGVSPGDTATVTVLVDNGGASTLSQTWALADVISASLTAGSYSASYSPPFFDLFSTPASVFVTDAGGTLIFEDFAGTATFGPHSDSFGSGGSVFLFNNGPSDFFGRSAPFGNAMSSNLRLWTGPVAVQVSEVPEPASFALLGAGLLGLGLLLRRRRVV